MGDLSSLFRVDSAPSYSCSELLVLQSGLFGLS